MLWRSRPADSSGAGAWRSEEEDSFSCSSSWLEEVGGSRLSLALELAVVPKYPSRDAPCWTADTTLLLWAPRVQEVTSGWLKKKADGQKLRIANRLNINSGEGEQVSDL